MDLACVNLGLHSSIGTGIAYTLVGMGIAEASIVPH